MIWESTFLIIQNSKMYEKLNVEKADWGKRNTKCALRWCSAEGLLQLILHGWPSGRIQRAVIDVINGLGASLIRSFSALQPRASLPCRNLLPENLIVKDLFSGNPNELISSV